MTLEEQVEFARKRCRELAGTRLAPHRVERSLQVDGIDQAIIDEAVAEYETLLDRLRSRDRLWWRLGALIVLICCIGYFMPLIFQQPFKLNKGHGVALGIGMLALLQFLMPNPFRLA